MNLPLVSEDFVQFVWKFGLFHQQNLMLMDGSKIQIINAGTQNFASGSDFFSAKVYIDKTLWVGNIEIHLSVKNWQQHQHHNDAAYNNVILHVVYFDEDESVFLENGRAVPTLSIGKLIYKDTLLKYKRLLQTEKTFIPCQAFIKEVDSFTFTQYYEALLFERLERKVKDIEQDLTYTQGDLDMAFLITLFKYFGAPKNKDAFELLARSFQLNQLIKQNLSVTQLESFLFGLSDLLKGQDAYASRLQNEFEYTKKLFQLKVNCKSEQWIYAGTRPPNFPTVRIAQLAALLHKNIRLFSVLIEMKDLKDVRNIFEIETSEYWKKHYNFGVESKLSTKKLSEAFIDKIVINVLAPFLFFYGKYVNEEKYIERAINFLTEIKAESNQIVKGFKSLKVPVITAFESQALIELKNNYCDNKKCLDCRIGYSLLKQDNH